MINEILHHLQNKRFNLHDEKILQEEIYKALVKALGDVRVEKEFEFDKNNIIDFRIDCSMGIEVKIKASKRAIYKQCERYCQFDTINSILLITNSSMGFPEQINGKDCYVLNLSKAWL